MVETLVVYLVVLTFFAGTWQLGELASAQLVVRRAASAAARAAAVVLSDDLESCALTRQEKELRIHLAASLVLRAAPHAELSELVYALEGTEANEQNVRVDLRVKYQCRMLPLLCLPLGHRELQANNTQAHQTARYGDCSNAPGSGLL
jgi:hypothetical protein